jgi:hypothetical protein
MMVLPSSFDAVPQWKIQPGKIVMLYRNQQMKLTQAESERNNEHQPDGMTKPNSAPMLPPLTRKQPFSWLACVKLRMHA